MATLNALTVSPNPVPDGSSGTVSVSFALAPGTLDQVGEVAVFKDGLLQGSGVALTLLGSPAEPTPTVKAGATNVGYEIRTNVGVLTELGSNQFKIVHS